VDQKFKTKTTAVLVHIEAKIKIHNSTLHKKVGKEKQSPIGVRKLRRKCTLHASTKSVTPNANKPVKITRQGILRKKKVPTLFFFLWPALRLLLFKACLLSGMPPCRTSAGMRTVLATAAMPVADHIHL
jgi:hypothetical protein